MIKRTFMTNMTDKFCVLKWNCLFEFELVFCDSVTTSEVNNPLQLFRQHTKVNYQMRSSVGRAVSYQITVRKNVFKNTIPY